MRTIVSTAYDWQALCLARDLAAGGEFTSVDGSILRTEAGLADVTLSARTLGIQIKDIQVIEAGKGETLFSASDFTCR